jgi:DNA-directed RNA polymerase subunit RPC12/RpoP
MDSTIVRCAECNIILQEDTNETKRIPCPNCRSLKRKFEKHLIVQTKIISNIMFKVRRFSKKDFVKKVIFGYVIPRDEKLRERIKWVYINRKIDREDDKYYEEVTNPVTGEVLHFCEEPLKEHIGHGSAKVKKDL